MSAAGMDEIAVTEITKHGESGWSLLARPTYGLKGTEIVLPRDAVIRSEIIQDGGFTKVRLIIDFTGDKVGTREHQF